MQSGGNRLTGDECSIGEWIFSPGGNELRRGAERRRLEDRAARTLELLCRRRGEIVSQEDILKEVWNGRAISRNSVPVVIKDIRKALADDARKPLHIETVSKRGYRLLPHPPDPALGNRTPVRIAEGPIGRRSVLQKTFPVLLAIILAGLAITDLGEREDVRLIVTDVENATGSSRYQPLATATSELITLNAQRLQGFRVLRATKAQSLKKGVTLSTRLILWEGRPTAMMSAENADGITVWTSMTSGDETLIPSEISAAIQDLDKSVKQVPPGRQPVRWEAFLASH